MRFSAHCFQLKIVSHRRTINLTALLKKSKWQKFWMKINQYRWKSNTENKFSNEPNFWKRLRPLKYQFSDHQKIRKIIMCETRAVNFATYLKLLAKKWKSLVLVKIVNRYRDKFWLLWDSFIAHDKGRVLTVLFSLNHLKTYSLCLFCSWYAWFALLSSWLSAFQVIEGCNAVAFEWHTNLVNSILFISIYTTIYFFF